MAIDLRNKPIAITGASSGIGAATALACAAAGMPVAIGARRADKLDSVVKRIRANGGRAIAIPMDVADPAQCRTLIDATVSEFGSLYAVYANAGYGVEKPVHEMTDDEVRIMFEINFFGTLNTIRPAIEHMRRAAAPTGRGLRGHVLICSSCLGKMFLPYFSVYSATKAAQNHIGRAMNLELRPERIAVSTVHPISTRTEFFETVEKLSGNGHMIEHSPEMFTQSADFVARCTTACLRSPRPEVWTGFAGHFVRFGMSVNTLIPRLADLSLYRPRREPPLPPHHVERRPHDRVLIDPEMTVEVRQVPRLTEVRDAQHRDAGRTDRRHERKGVRVAVQNRHEWRPVMRGENLIQDRVARPEEPLP
jgi:short-subunit dehydrogenase